MSPRVKCSINRAQIRRLWNLRRNGTLTVKRFLAIAANNISDFVGVLLFRGEFRAGEFEPVLHPPPDANIPDFEYQGPDPNPQELFHEMNFDDLRAMIHRELARPFLPRELGEALAEMPIPDDIADEEEEEEVDPAMEFEWRCSKCRLSKGEMISKPCNCFSICRPCEQIMRREAQADGIPLICPTCEGRAVNYERVYLSDSNNEAAPYDFRCQICEVNLVSMMGRYCHHLMICGECVGRIELRERPGRCPFCRRQGGFVRVHFQEAQNP